MKEGVEKTEGFKHIMSDCAGKPVQDSTRPSASRPKRREKWGKPISNSRIPPAARNVPPQPKRSERERKRKANKERRKENNKKGNTREEKGGRKVENITERIRHRLAFGFLSLMDLRFPREMVLPKALGVLNL